MASNRNLSLLEITDHHSLKPLHGWRDCRQHWTATTGCWKSNMSLSMSCFQVCVCVCVCVCVHMCIHMRSSYCITHHHQCDDLICLPVSTFICFVHSDIMTLCYVIVCNLVVYKLHHEIVCLQGPSHLTPLLNCSPVSSFSCLNCHLLHASHLLSPSSL